MQITTRAARTEAATIAASTPIEGVFCVFSVGTGTKGVFCRATVARSVFNTSSVTSGNLCVVPMISAIEVLTPRLPLGCTEACVGSS